MPYFLMVSESPITVKECLGLVMATVPRAQGRGFLLANKTGDGSLLGQDGGRKERGEREGEKEKAQDHRGVLSVSSRLTCHLPLSRLFSARNPTSPWELLRTKLRITADFSRP